MGSLTELRLGDIDTFLAVKRFGSISGAARELMVTPSQVSRAIGRLESHFRTRLFRRNAQGVQLSESGARFAPRLEQIVGGLREMELVEDEAGPLVTFAAPSYVNALLLPAVAAAAADVRIRCLELPPSLVRTLASGNLFDATVLLGTAWLPPIWHVTPIGTCRKALFASPKVAQQLGPEPVPLERLKPFRFVRPVYNVGGQFVAVDDDCPLLTRRQGHEAQTVANALELAAVSDQLVYGPAFAAAQHVERGAVVEVRVEGWNERDEMHFACNAERMLARIEAVFVAALREAHGRLEPPRGGNRAVL